MVWFPRNKNQTYRLNSMPHKWPSDLTLGETLTLNFQGQIRNLLYLSQERSDCHETKSKHIKRTLSFKCNHRICPWPWPWPWIFKVKYEIAIWQPKMVWFLRNKKHTYGLNSMPQMWPSDLSLAMTLTMNFQGQIWNLLYLSQGWFDCPKMKSTHIEWTESLNDHQVWPWPWTWKVRYKDLLDSDQGDFRYTHAVDSLGFSKLFLACSLCVAYVSEDNDFNV